MATIPRRACIWIEWQDKRHWIELVNVSRPSTDGTLHFFSRLWALPGGRQVSEEELKMIAKENSSIVKYVVDDVNAKEWRPQL